MSKKNISGYFMEKGAPPYHILKLSFGYQKNNFNFVMIIKKY
jgi:hypothetical protein